MTKRISTILICFILAFSRSAMAWNAEGHMTVAQIAYNHLSQTAKLKCDALIAVSLTNVSVINNTFVTSACWADDNKTALTTGNWHFIDLPISLDATPTNFFNVPASNVVQAINVAIANLQNTNTTLTNQAVYLRYLIHFVGDIQQPLHCSTALSASQTNGDAGGNGFSITGEWSNLHSLWDAGGGFLDDFVSRPLDPTGQGIINTNVVIVEGLYPYDYAAHLGTIPNPMTWAVEGQSLAKTNSYVGITRSTTPSTTYLDTTIATTKQRMAQGGHRLADLLNTLYPASPISLSFSKPAGGNFVFSWNATPGVNYGVQWKQQFSDPAWNTLTNVLATTNTVAITNALSANRRFYRVTQ